MKKPEKEIPSAPIVEALNEVLEHGWDVVWYPQTPEAVAKQAAVRIRCMKQELDREKRDAQSKWDEVRRALDIAYGPSWVKLYSGRSAWDCAMDAILHLGSQAKKKENNQMPNTADKERESYERMVQNAPQSPSE